MHRLEFIFPGFQRRAAKAFAARRKPIRKVFKFGSSVLRTPEDLPRVAGEIYRNTRHGEQVIAVVSAFEGETDALLAACRQSAGSTDCSGFAEAVSLGEEKTAALLKIACDRVGLEARVARPEAFGILTKGSLSDAEPTGLSAELACLEGAKVVIVPGFVGIDGSGCRSLLGRGGSDFSAIYIGGELEADCVRLYKDVDGVYDHDPADHSRPSHRFNEVSWSDCLTLARPLLQPRAVEYAERKGVQLEVAAIGGSRSTIVGQKTQKPVDLDAQPRLRIALAGYGTVGQALAERLSREEQFEFVGILVRNIDKERLVAPPVALTDDRQAFEAIDADVFVDLTSCEVTGHALSLQSLERGIPVISANKQVIGNHLEDLENVAVSTRAELLYSAAVGGSTPMIEAVRLAFNHGEILRIDAILNGTVNFILDQLARGQPADEAVRRAQEAGFAEEDPSQDLSGRDAALKLQILAAQIVGPERAVEIAVEPIDAARLHDFGRGKRWIQHSSLSFAGRTIQGSVRIREAAKVSDLEAPACERNTITVTTIDGATFVATGRGAGGAATAEAVTADLYDVWKDLSRRAWAEAPGGTRAKCVKVS